jgi:hypothetical protein
MNGATQAWETRFEDQERKGLLVRAAVRGVGVGFAWGATAYNFGSSARPGPAYFPFGLGVLTACLGGLILFKV